MANKAQKYVNVARCAYLCILTVYTILREVIPLQELIGHPLLSYAFFGMGFAVIAADFVVNRGYIRIKNMPLLLAFTAVCVISTLLNFRYAFVSNLKAIGWMCVFFLLVYPCGYHDGFGGEKMVKAVFTTAVITFTAVVAVSLPMYFYNVDYTFYKITGALTNQGFSSEYVRLWGVFQEANYAGVYAAITAMMAAYLFAKSRKLWSRVLTVIAMVLLTLFIVLTGSRTAKLALAMTAAWGAFYYAFTKFRNAAISRRVFRGVLLCVLAAVVTYVGLGVTGDVLPYVKKAVISISGEEFEWTVHKCYDRAYQLGNVNVIEGYLKEDTAPPVDPEDPTEKDEVESLDRNDLKGKEDISNGRFTRWKDGLDIFTAAPVFGTSPRGIYEFAKVHRPDTTMAKYYYSVTNFLLEILVGTGIVGVVIAVLLLFRIAASVLCNTIRKVFSGRMLLCSCIALLLIIASMLETDLFFNLTFGSVTFWLVVGMIISTEANGETLKSKQ